MEEKIYLPKEEKKNPSKKGYVFANFGGPRKVEEIVSFLEALLTDRDVITTRLPNIVHQWLFKRIARRRARRIEGEYLYMGGRSPIYEDTESIAEALRSLLDGPLVTFHRYLPSTHVTSLQSIEKMEVEQIVIFPLFPQFTYATTGSIARFFARHLSPTTGHKLRWIKSYPTHEAFISLYQKLIREFLQEYSLLEEETFLLFSAHGLPKRSHQEGDPYFRECHDSMQEIAACFPRASALLSFQSRFGPEEWLQPYTEEVCKAIHTYAQGRTKVVVIPISFTSDHLETLVEVEKQYLPLIQAAGLSAYRLPAFNRHPEWIRAIPKILNASCYSTTSMLLRR